MHVRELFDLTGEVAVITGGSRGIGKEMAVGLGEAGATVVITARRKETLDTTVQEMREQGIDCVGEVGDVSDYQEMLSLRDRVMVKYQKVDILVNNAGVGWGAPAEDMPFEKWKMVNDINSTGVFICSQIFGREMIKNRKGKIVNISSVGGLFSTDPVVMTAIGYNASKGAVIAMTKQMAREWAPHGVYVNAVAPGFFPTALTDSVLKHAEQRARQRIALGRFGQLDEIKGVIVFLASRASNYLVGETIVVDGGAYI